MQSAKRSETSDWADENARGRSYADDVIDIIRDRANPTYLGRVCQAMIKKGEYGGFEVGFFHAIASRLA